MSLFGPTADSVGEARSEIHWQMVDSFKHLESKEECKVGERESKAQIVL